MRKGKNHEKNRTDREEKAQQSKEKKARIDLMKSTSEAEQLRYMVDEVLPTFQFKNPIFQNIFQNLSFLGHCNLDKILILLGQVV